MPWLRRGACPPERCRGRCCERVGVWLDKSGDAAPFIEVLRTRGVEVIETAEDHFKALAMIDQRCRYLTPDGKCSLHPDMDPPAHLPARPQFCWDWPQEPSQIIAEDCGFWFEWVEESECVAWPA